MAIITTTEKRSWIYHPTQIPSSFHALEGRSEVDNPHVNIAQTPGQISVFALTLPTTDLVSLDSRTHTKLTPLMMSTKIVLQ